MRALKLSDLSAALRAKVKRSPRGAAANALPEYWVEVHAHGLVLMVRSREGGDDVTLALISDETLAVLRMGRDVKGLT